MMAGADAYDRMVPLVAPAHPHGKVIWTGLCVFIPPVRTDVLCC